MMQTSTNAPADNKQVMQLSSSQDSIMLVEKILQDLCAPYYVNEDIYGNMLVALTEAVTNAIQHGNKFADAKKVILTCAGANDGLQFTITDQGNGFDPNVVPDPTAPENIEKPNGRGVFLMKHLADGVSYNDEGRTVVLDFKLHHANTEAVAE